MKQDLRRISMLIKEDQYKFCNDHNLNISGLIRDLLDDHISEHKIVLSVTEDTRNLYNEIIANTGATDEDLEPFLKAALSSFVSQKIGHMKALQSKLEGPLQ